METTTENLTHRQTIIVRMSDKDAAGGLIDSEHEQEVIYLQHSKRMPGFMQIDNGGAIQYVPVDAFVRLACTCVHDDGTVVPGENPDCPIDGWTEPRQIDMDNVAALVRQAGVFCVVEMTGGGVSTIFAGEEIEPGRYQAAAGPGSFHSHNGSTYQGAYAYEDEFYVGKDDGEADYDGVEGLNDERIAALILEYVRKP